MKKILSMLLVLILALSTATFAFAEEESDADYILGNGVLNIGITLFAPINYEDPETGDLIGFDTELAKAVCADLGIEANFIVISWDAKEIELNSKNIDCIWNGMCIYLLNTQAMVMKADREEEIMADVNGYTVVAEQGSTGEGKLQGTIEDDDTVEVSAQEYFAGCTYIPVGSMANALLEVKSGTADIALVDSVCALGMVRPDSDYADLVVNMDNNFGDQFYGIAFRKGSDFTAMVNESIAKLKEDGTVAELAEKSRPHTAMTR